MSISPSRTSELSASVPHSPTGSPTGGPAPATGPRAARTVLAAGVGLGILADLLLRNAPDGLGWTIWVLLLATAAMVIARRGGDRLGREPFLWLGVAVLCAVAFSWRDLEELRVANVFGSLVALAMFSMVATGRPTPSVLVTRLRDVLASGVYAFLEVVAGTPMLVAREAELSSLPALRAGAYWSAVRAVLLTVPVALVFGALLSRADPAFAALFSFPAIDLERIAPHVVTAGAFAWWSAGWMRGALLRKTRRSAIPDQVPIQLGLAEVTSVLGAVIVLFALFVGLQLRWLFGGAEAVLATTGLTLAEYARRGFFELVWVAALVLPLILGSRATVIDTQVERRHRLLSLILIALLIAIMVSAAMRMRLYIGYFGLTTDRFIASVMMSWLALVTVALLFSLARAWFRPLAAVIVLSGYAVLLLVNVLNPDARVARVNAARAASVRAVDYAYLAKLSGDAVPDVVQALRSSEPSPVTCQAARTLRTRWSPSGEASWNLGVQRARRAVESRLPAEEEQRLCRPSTP